METEQKPNVLRSSVSTHKERNEKGKIVIESNFSLDKTLAALTPLQLGCRHGNVVLPDPCPACGARLTKSELTALRRMASGRVVDWQEPELTPAQEACEKYGHAGHRIEFAGYARVGAKMFPHRLGKCANCGVVRLRPQFSEKRRQVRRAQDLAEARAEGIMGLGWLR